MELEKITNLKKPPIVTVVYFELKVYQNEKQT